MFMYGRIKYHSRSKINLLIQCNFFKTQLDYMWNMKSTEELQNSYESMRSKNTSDKCEKEEQEGKLWQSQQFSTGPVIVQPVSGMDSTKHVREPVCVIRRIINEWEKMDHLLNTWCQENQLSTWRNNQILTSHYTTINSRKGQKV